MAPNPNTSRRRLPDTILCLITQVSLWPKEDQLLRCIEESVKGGVNMVQVRDKALKDDELYRLTQRVLKVAGTAVVMVNDNPEVAIAAGAHGVHLPERSAVTHTESQLLVGKSVHSVASTRKAQEQGVDFVFAGSLFASKSHRNRLTLGLAGFAQCVEAVSLPVIGIGGINSTRAGCVMQHGGCGVAVIRAISQATSPQQAARNLNLAMERV